MHTYMALYSHYCKASIAKIFTLEGGKFNIVFNLAAETKYGQTDAVSIIIGLWWYK